MNQWMLLLLFPSALVIMLSSLCGSAEDGELNDRTTRVCDTAEGNGSRANCTVPYDNTELVLRCASSELSPLYVVRWTKDNCSSEKLLSGDQNYTVNDQGRRLTNDDSAIYCCMYTWNSVPEYRYIHINVHAPPQLNDVDTCEGVDRNNCFMGDKKLHSSDYSIDVYVSFTDNINGPFSVQWYHNNTEFNCWNSNLCIRMLNKSNSQTLTLQRLTIEDGWMISGGYTAVVSNPYGSNTSISGIKYDCVSPVTEHQESQTRTLSLTKGEKLDYSFCQLSGSNSFDVVVCLTRNKSDNIEQLLRNTPGNCTEFSDNVSTRKFNNSLTKMQVSMFEERHDYCFPHQLVKFVKNGVSLHDDGIIILSGYKVYTQITQYCSVHLRVRHSQILLCMLVLVVAVPVLVIALVIVIVKYRGCFKSRETNSEDEHRALLRESDGEEDRSEYTDMQACVRSEEYSTSQRISSLEATIGPIEFPDNLSDGPESCVQLHFS